MMHRLAAFAATVVSSLPAFGEVLFSQYYEGASNDKWIELTNTAEEPVLLDGYVVASFTNQTAEAWKSDGAVPNNLRSLDGFSIGANGFLLIGNPQAALPSYATADLESEVTFFNGNDSLVLYNTALGVVGNTAAIVDAIGFVESRIDEGNETSFYRLSNAPGYNLDPDSTVLDFPAVWGETTPAAVNDALESDPWYLHSFASSVTDELTVVLDPATIAEDGGTGLVDVTVTRSGSTAAALDISLSSSDETEAVIPLPQRQIPAGQASETFAMAIDAVDDMLADGTQVVIITASAAGVLSGTAELEVTDDGDVAVLAINEILADPPLGAEGDANRDGVRDGGADEFVEIVNTSGAPLDISFWQLVEGAGGLRHTFPIGTVLPVDCAVVVFGGGSTAALGGAALYQVASNPDNGSLGLNNNGDTVTVLDEFSTPVASYTYGVEGGNAESLTRDPDVTGSFVGHPAAAGAVGRFSPGTKVDGSQFCAVEGALAIELSATSMSESGGSIVATITRTGDLSAELEVIVQIDDETEAETDLILDTAFIEAGEAAVDVVINAVDDIAPDGPQLVTVTATALGYTPGVATFEVLDDGDGPFAALVINEILYDPPAGLAGDANGDGVRGGSPDEFIEILNVSGADFDLSGFRIIDNFGTRHVFAAGTVLADGQAIVVFGGGSPVGFFGGSLVQVASTGLLGLNNDGDEVILAAPDGSELLRVEYDGSVRGQSLTRDPDGSGDFVAHSTATDAGGALFSVGAMVDGAPFPGGSSGPAPIVLESIEVDFAAHTVTVTVSGLDSELSYDFDSSTDLGDSDFWRFRESFRTDDGSEVAPGVFEFTFDDPSIATEPMQFYRVVRF